MNLPPPLTFAPLSKIPSVIHGFSLRLPCRFDTIPPARVWASAWGMPPAVVEADQPHGHNLAIVEDIPKGPLAEVDALATDRPDLTLAIRCADCGPLFIMDPHRGVIAVVHSGRKGTAENIAGFTVQRLSEAFGCHPEDLVTVLGPCIRPPDYPIDFAAAILQQLRDCGCRQVFDCGLNTAQEPDRFYSYRREGGRTGRHFALIARRSPGATHTPQLSC